MSRGKTTCQPRITSCYRMLPSARDGQPTKIHRRLSNAAATSESVRRRVILARFSLKINHPNDESFRCELRTAKPEPYDIRIRNKSGNHPSDSSTPSFDNRQHTSSPRSLIYLDHFACLQHPFRCVHTIPELQQRQVKMDPR